MAILQKTYYKYLPCGIDSNLLDYYGGYITPRPLGYQVWKDSEKIGSEFLYKHGWVEGTEVLVFLSLLDMEKIQPNTEFISVFVGGENMERNPYYANEIKNNLKGFKYIATNQSHDYYIKK